MATGRVRGVWRLLPVALPTVLFLAMLASSLVGLVRHAARLESSRKAARQPETTPVPGPVSSGAEDDFWSHARTHAQGPDSEPLRVYRVDRSITDLIGAPATPEAAYAECACVAHRNNAVREEAWPEQVAEVWLFHHHYAAVLAASSPPTGQTPCRLYLLESVRGRWRLTGGVGVASVAKGRTRVLARYVGLRDAGRPPHERPRGEMDSVYALDQPGALRSRAQHLLRHLREVDYESPASLAAADLQQRLGDDYEVTDLAAWAGDTCAAFRGNPITRVEVGSPFVTSRSRTQRLAGAEMLLPLVPYRLTLRDGSALSGQLRCRARLGSSHGATFWRVVGGLDWHLPRASSGPVARRVRTL